MCYTTISDNIDQKHQRWKSGLNTTLALAREVGTRGICFRKINETQKANLTYPNFCVSFCSIEETGEQQAASKNNQQQRALLIKTLSEVVNTE